MTVEQTQPVISGGQEFYEVSDKLLTRENLKALIAASLQSFEMSGHEFDPDKLGKKTLYFNDPVAFAEEICHKMVADYHKDILTLQDEHLQTLIIGPSGHGKTTIGTVVYNLWRLTRNQNLRILLGSKKAGNASNMLREIKEIAMQDMFIDLYGLWNDRRNPNTTWTTGAITIPRTIINKEPSITAVGINSTVPSLHAEILAFDDMCDKDNSRTAYMRKKLSEWFWGEFFSRRQPGSEMHGAGTRFHAQDLYSEIIKKAQEDHWQYQLFQIWRDQEKRIPLWPEMYSPEEIDMMRRDQGQIRFDMFYMGIAHLGEGGRIVKREHIRRVKGIGPELFKVISVDPAVGAQDLDLDDEEDSDYFALGVWSVDQNFNATLIDLYRDRPSSNQQIQVIAEYMKRYKPMYTAIESVVFSNWLPNNLKQSQYYPVLPYTPKGDKVLRLVKVQPHFEQGKIRVLESIPHLEAYEIEVAEFPGAEFDDMVDMTSMALDVIYNNLLPQMSGSGQIRAGGG